MLSIRLLVDLPQDRRLARLCLRARFVALNSAARAGRVALIWPARTGRCPGQGEAQEGLCAARSSGALPSPRSHWRSGREDAKNAVVIGMDPHKRSATIEVMAGDEAVLGGGRLTQALPGTGRTG